MSTLTKGKGDIYKIRCKETGLEYIGLAPHFKPFDENEKWGAQKRYRDHFNDAKTEEKYEKTMSELHKAMMKYGPDNFEIEILVCCDEKYLDHYEQHFIKDYNTVYPNGYNMTEGGKHAKHCDKAKENMSKGQVGKRYTHKVERKFPEDANLPKYIAPIRKSEEDDADRPIIGYQIKKFPVGISEKDYIYKTFKNINDPPSALKMAIEELEKLKIQYANIPELKKQQARMIKEAENMSLPDNIFPVLQNNEITGYFVMHLKDYEDKPISRHDFQTLQDAQVFITNVKKYNEEKKVPIDWLLLTQDYDIQDLLNKVIKESTYRKVHNGYYVKYFKKYDDKKKPIMIDKRFTDPNKTIEDKYTEACQYVQSLIESSS